MSDFTRALYAELFDATDGEELDHAMREWSLASNAERSFAQVQLLWLLHAQLSELTAETTTLSEVLRRLNAPPPDILDVEPIELIEPEVVHD